MEIAMTRVRVTHSQTTEGPLLLNDIEDGMPREPFAYLHKQQVYIPRNDPVDSTIAGFTDLVPSDKVLASLDNGVIAGLEENGYILTPVLYTDADVAAPTLASGVLAGTLTLTGTAMTSLAPVLTQVVITGAGAVSLDQNQILGAGGTIGATSIVVPAALIPGVSTTTSSVAVTADRQTTAPVVIS